MMPANEAAGVPRVGAHLRRLAVDVECAGLHAHPKLAEVVATHEEAGTALQWRGARRHASKRGVVVRVRDRLSRAA